MASVFSPGLGALCLISMRIETFSVSSLRDGEERRAKALPLSYSIRDSGTGKMTTVTFLQSSEDPQDPRY